MNQWIYIFTGVIYVHWNGCDSKLYWSLRWDFITLLSNRKQDHMSKILQAKSVSTSSLDISEIRKGWHPDNTYCFNHLSTPTASTTCLSHQLLQQPVNTYCFNHLSYLLLQPPVCHTYCFNHLSVIPIASTTCLSYLLFQPPVCHTYCFNHLSVIPIASTTCLSHLLLQPPVCHTYCFN